MEHKAILVQRYRSPDGAPTCCADQPAGQVCRFLGARNFGTVDVCLLGGVRDLAPRTTDFQRPDSRCEVWGQIASLTSSATRRILVTQSDTADTLMP